LQQSHTSSIEITKHTQNVVESVVIHRLTQLKAGKIFGLLDMSMCKYMKEYKEHQAESYKYKELGVKVGTGSTLRSNKFLAVCKIKS
jgi:hypothetical protein